MPLPHMILIPSSATSCKGCAVKALHGSDPKQDDALCNEANTRSQEATGQSCFSSPSIYSLSVRGVFQRFKRLPDGRYEYTFITDAAIPSGIVYIQPETP